MRKILLLICSLSMATVCNAQTNLNQQKIEIVRNDRLVALLDTVFNEDQRDRLHMDAIQKQYGWQSKQMDSLMQQMGYHDSINLIKVKYIVDTYGWLGPNVVGERGASTIFTIIQHADSSTQATYLPKMQQAVKEGKAKSQQLALLVDRVLVNQGKAQLYGSQIRRNEQTGKNELFPISDEQNVNKRRTSAGLEPLEDYAKKFGIKYAALKAKTK